MTKIYYFILTDESLYTVRIPVTHHSEIPGFGIRLGTMDQGEIGVLLRVINGAVELPDGRRFAFYTHGNPHPQMHNEERTVRDLEQQRKNSRAPF